MTKLVVDFRNFTNAPENLVGNQNVVSIGTSHTVKVSLVYGLLVRGGLSAGEEILFLFLSIQTGCGINSHSCSMSIRGFCPRNIKETGA